MFYVYFMCLCVYFISIKIIKIMIIIIIEYNPFVSLWGFTFFFLIWKKLPLSLFSRCHVQMSQETMLICEILSISHSAFSKFCTRLPLAYQFRFLETVFPRKVIMETPEKIFSHHLFLFGRHIFFFPERKPISLSRWKSYISSSNYLYRLLIGLNVEITWLLLYI